MATTHALAAMTIRVADLFAGCGGLTAGIPDAEARFAVDTDQRALDVYSANHHPQWRTSSPVETVVDGELGAPPTQREKWLAWAIGCIDILVGGPPCQGNSMLNNHTRFDDPRNELYLRMVRFAEVAEPATVLIENVPGVVRSGMVKAALAELERLGYFTDHGVVDCSDLGLPQRRKRHVLLAALTHKPSVEVMCHYAAMPAPTALEAIEDFADLVHGDMRHRPAKLSTESQRRIDYLFDHDLYELPSAERPDCHRLKQHGYNDVYGRMRPDQPAPTITTRFAIAGCGRFTHPTRRRTLTSAEAARLQGFPDSYVWLPTGTDMTATALRTMIGNAAPPVLAQAAARELRLLP